METTTHTTHTHTKLVSHNGCKTDKSTGIISWTAGNPHSTTVTISQLACSLIYLAAWNSSHRPMLSTEVAKNRTHTHSCDSPQIYLDKTSQNGKSSCRCTTDRLRNPKSFNFAQLTANPRLQMINKQADLAQVRPHKHKCVAHINIMSLTNKSCRHTSALPVSNFQPDSSR
jgi:hypothetical protein